jgi:hypothetical protein
MLELLWGTTTPEALQGPQSAVVQAVMWRGLSRLSDIGLGAIVGAKIVRLTDMV